MKRLPRWLYAVFGAVVGILVGLLICAVYLITRPAATEAEPAAAGKISVSKGFHVGPIVVEATVSAT